MVENFDKKFGHRIKEVFDDREISYNPEDWERLKAKMSDGKKKDRLFFWYFNKSAAIVLLFLMLGGLGGIVFYNSSGNKNTPIHHENEVIIGNTDATQKSNENNSDSVNGQDSLINPINNLNKNPIDHFIDENKNSITNTDSKNKIPSIKENTPLNRKEASGNPNNIITNQRVQESKIIITNHEKNSNESTKLITEQLIKSKLKKDSIQLVENESEIVTVLQEPFKNLKNIDSVATNNETVIADSNTSAQLDSLTKKDINSVSEKMNKKEDAKNGITFGLAISPIVNYNEATQNTNVNIGGGVIIEIPVFKNIELYTGLLITNQKINLQEKSLETIAAGRQLKSKDASLTGLDVPINLKYNFSLNKTKMFITTGLSSTTYFKENIESTYQVSSTILTEGTDELGNPILVSNIIETTENQTESKGSFNSFNFGKIVNFSFGVELPLKNNRQAIIIEPYFKYSLQPLTSEQINFSSGGVNLKLNFHARKKSN